MDGKDEFCVLEERVIFILFLDEDRDERCLSLKLYVNGNNLFLLTKMPDDRERG